MFSFKNYNKLTVKLGCFLNRKLLMYVPLKNVHHIPVLKEEVNHYLNPAKDNIILDMTFGGGGHTKYLLSSMPSLKILCLDRDPTAYRLALELSKLYPNQVIPCLGKFSELPHILKTVGISYNSIDGILFDFGCSSMQMNTASRGFSISHNAELDMRMDGDRFPNSPTAADVLKYCDEEELSKIFKIYGEEKLAKKIARGVIEARYTFTPLKTTKDLASLVENICFNKFKQDKLQRPAHVATKIFQALRIFVNNELNEIYFGLIIAHKYLKIGGRLVTISFHSLEDRIVKQHITGILEDAVVPIKQMNHCYVNIEKEIQQVKDSNWVMLNKHVVTPSDLEITSNPRSRSAKLRAAVKIK